MLILDPHAGDRYRIAAIDPGTHRLGLTFLDIDLASPDRKLIVTDVYTHRGEKLMARNHQYTELYGEALGMRMAHLDNLKRQFEIYQPNCVVSEAPYLGRLPAAFRALVEMIAVIRQAAWETDRMLLLETVDPPTVKRAVGTKGKDKEDVRRGLARQEFLSWECPNTLAELDEHSCDAIAVGVWKYKQLLGIADYATR